MKLDNEELIAFGNRSGTCVPVIVNSALSYEYNNRKENEALHYELGYPKWRGNTLYAPCPKIRQKN